MKSRPAASCVGGPAWSKAQGSESCPVGVRRFKSCPTHLVGTGCGRCHPALLLDIDSISEPSRGKSRGHEHHLDSRMESVGGGHHLQRHPGGRQFDQIRGGTSRSPNDRTPCDGGLPSGRGPSDRLLDLSGAGPRCTSPHNRARDRLRGRPGCTCSCRFVWLPRCWSLVVPRFRDDPGGPELAQAPLRDTRRGGTLADVYRGFTRWQTVRAILQLAAFVAVVLALASLAPFGQRTKRDVGLVLG